MCVVRREVAQESPRVVSTSTTSTSVHISWSSPFFVGAPLIGYRLSVAAVGGSELTERVKEVLVSSHHLMSDVVTLLQPDTDYTLSVAALNQFGAGVPATVTVRTLPHSVREFSTASVYVRPRPFGCPLTLYSFILCHLTTFLHFHLFLCHSSTVYCHYFMHIFIVLCTLLVFSPHAVNCGRFCFWRH